MLDRSLTLSLFEGFMHCTLPISAGSVTGTLADCEGSHEVKSGTLIIGRFSFKHVFFLEQISYFLIGLISHFLAFVSSQFLHIEVHQCTRDRQNHLLLMCQLYHH